MSASYRGSEPTRAVWKFPLVVDDVQFVEMPENAAILCVQTQNEQPCLWAMVDPDASTTRRRKILMAGTGHVREDLYGFVAYIGTFQLRQGALVFHVFESVFGGEPA